MPHGAGIHHTKIFLADCQTRFQNGLSINTCTWCLSQPPMSFPWCSSPGDKCIVHQKYVSWRPPDSDCTATIDGLHCPILCQNNPSSLLKFSLGILHPLSERRRRARNSRALWRNSFYHFSILKSRYYPKIQMLHFYAERNTVVLSSFMKISLIWWTKMDKDGPKRIKMGKN